MNDPRAAQTAPLRITPSSLHAFVRATREQIPDAALAPDMPAQQAERWLAHLH